MSNKPIFAYWDIRGLGQPIRFLLAYIGLDFEEKRYEIGSSEWPEKDKFNLGLDFPNLPYWIEGDIKLTESKAIMKYLAREKSENLMPKTLEDERKADMLESFISDLWFTLILTCMGYTDDLRANFAKNMPPKFEQLSKFMGSHKFIFGDNITYLDFLLYEVLYHFTVFQSDFLKPYPKIEDYKHRFEGLPPIAEYIHSSKYIKGPCINPFATYKI